MAAQMHRRSSCDDPEHLLSIVPIRFQPSCSRSLASLFAIYVLKFHYEKWIPLHANHLQQAWDGVFSSVLRSVQCKCTPNVLNLDAHGLIVFFKFPKMMYYRNRATAKSFIKAEAFRFLNAKRTIYVPKQ